MASVTRYQDLDCYKLAVEIRSEVLRLTGREAVRRDFKFVSQIRDSARGGPRNISEGFSRFNPHEILQFLSYAKASIDETRNHMVDGQESGYFTVEQTDKVIVLIRRVLAAIRKWMQYLESPSARRFYQQHQARKRRGEPKRTANPKPEPEPEP